MSDIFHEVEEEVRREELAKLWKRYGDYIIAAVAVLVLGVAGYKLWQSYEARQTLKASNEYLAAMNLGESGSTANATAAFSQIARSAPSGYSETAKLAEADMLAEAHKIPEAVALYKTIASQHNDEIGDVARLRAAWAQADSASCADQQAILKPLSDPASAWRYMANEIIAYCDFRDGQMKKAESEFEALRKDTTAPQALRGRAGAMAQLIRAGGDYGTVPPPAKQADGAANADNTKAKP